MDNLNAMEKLLKRIRQKTKNKSKKEKNKKEKNKRDEKQEKG